VLGGDFEHSRGGANAETLCQAGQHVDEQLHGDLLAMQERAVVLREKVFQSCGFHLRLTPQTHTD
jgi:hypothetical protein